MTNNVFGTKILTTTKQKSKHKNPCQSRRSNLRALTTHSDTLPLDHESTEHID